MWLGVPWSDLACGHALAEAEHLGERKRLAVAIGEPLIGELLHELAQGDARPLLDAQQQRLLRRVLLQAHPIRSEPMAIGDLTRALAAAHLGLQLGLVVWLTHVNR